MIQLAPQMRIFAFTEATDFRRGIDGLVRTCRERLESEDPMSGALFVFINRARTAIKALVYDGQGFWLMMKRLSQGEFRHWPTHGGSIHVDLATRELQVLLWNGDPAVSRMGSDWRRIVLPAAN